MKQEAKFMILAMFVLVMVMSWVLYFVYSTWTIHNKIKETTMKLTFNAEELCNNIRADPRYLPYFCSYAGYFGELK